MPQAKLAKLRRELLEPSSGGGAGAGKGEGAALPPLWDVAFPWLTLLSLSHPCVPKHVACSLIFWPAGHVQGSTV